MESAGCGPPGTQSLGGRNIDDAIHDTYAIQTRRGLGADEAAGHILQNLPGRPVERMAVPAATAGFDAQHVAALKHIAVRQRREFKPLSDGNTLKRGDVLRMETGGGGGHGHPFDRPAEKVLEDVAGGFVSAEAAKSLYGVSVVDGVVDVAATERLRSRRPATRAFHRHEYVDSLA